MKEYPYRRSVGRLYKTDSAQSRVAAPAAVQRLGYDQLAVRRQRRAAAPLPTVTEVSGCRFVNGEQLAPRAAAARTQQLLLLLLGMTTSLLLNFR